MTLARALARADAARARLQAVGLLCVGALAALLAIAPPWNLWLQAAWFDACQRLAPRSVAAMPATIVAVDERSIAAIGQWPWPRTRLAELVRSIDRHRPAAIGIDILMTEPDRWSPQQALASLPDVEPALAARVAALPSNDTTLARAIAAAPVVLAVATSASRSDRVLRAPPVTLQDPARATAQAPPLASRLPGAAGALSSIDELDRAARGHGIIDIDPASAVVRRVPLMIDVAGTLAPALAIEMLRVALGQPALRVVVDGADVRGIAIGDVLLPTEDDGAARVYFSHGDPRRYVSAIDVLQDRIDPASVRDKLVLIGATAVVGLNDNQRTPLRDLLPGSEIHAQLLENLVESTWLRRPTHAPAIELGVFIALGIALVVVTPRTTPPRAALVAAACVLLPLVAALVAHRSLLLVFDAATPALHLLLLFGVLLVSALTEAARQRRTLEATVRRERERAAFVAGEFEAATRIQTGMLPPADTLRDEPRIDLAATMIPAREVGGDLYDFFRLDDDRLFFMIGDVAGKGLSASIFMAVSKALCKSTALRSRSATVGELVSAANGEVARDNSEMLFVTAFVGILDLATGQLEFCTAGHDNPYLLHADQPAPTRLVDPGGPPLCVVDGFDYPSAGYRMRAGERLCLVSDGVTEARDRAGGMYGSQRLATLLQANAQAAVPARAIVDAVCADVAAFATGADAADDMTVMVLCWRGPGPAPER